MWPGKAITLSGASTWVAVDGVFMETSLQRTIRAHLRDLRVLF
jgi:hypothetical protein